MKISLTQTQRNWGWFWWLFQLFILPLILTQSNLLLGAPLTGAQLNFLFFCVNFIATTLILGPFVLGSCRLGAARIFYTLRAAFLGFALCSLVRFLIGLAIVSLFPNYVNQNDSSVQEMLRQSPLLMNLGILFLVPVSEELMYRGVIFGSLRSRSRLLAYSVSAGLFSLIHILGYTQEPAYLVISFIQYLPAGLCLAWAYERSGSILTPILMHIALNQMGISFMR